LNNNRFPINIGVLGASSASLKTFSNMMFLDEAFELGSDKATEVYFGLDKSSKSKDKDLKKYCKTKNDETNEKKIEYRYYKMFTNEDIKIPNILLTYVIYKNVNAVTRDLKLLSDTSFKRDINSMNIIIVVIDYNNKDSDLEFFKLLIKNINNKDVEIIVL